MQAFILAGGFATRLWPLTEARAKPLLPLAGKPIINYLVDTIPAHIPIAVSTNAAYGQDFRDWQQEYGYSNVTIIEEHTMNDDQKLGTLGALSQWATDFAIDDDVLLLTGDNYFGCPLERIITAFDGATSLVAAYDVQDLQEASRYGTVLVEPGSNEQLQVVTGFEEKPAEPKTSLVSTGASIIPKAHLPVVHEYAKHKPDDVGGIFEEFLAQNIAVQTFIFTELWYDIGSFWAYLEATEKLVGPAVQKHATATIANTLCEGSVVLGKNVQVRNASLCNVVVFDDVLIEDCVLENCIVDKDTIIKHVDIQGKMIRANSKLVNTRYRLPEILPA